MKSQKHTGLNGGGGWFKRLWQGAAVAVGGAIGGPIGAILVSALLAYLDQRSFDENLPPHIDNQLNQWAQSFLKPFFVQTAQSLTVTNISQVSTANFVNQFNSTLKQVKALHSYFEFKASTSTGDQKLIWEQKAKGVYAHIGFLLNTYNEASMGVSTPYSIYEYSFSPTAYINIGGLQLNWTGAQGIVANGPQLLTAPQTNKPSNGKPLPTSNGKPRPTSNKPKPPVVLVSKPKPTVVLVSNPKPSVGITTKPEMPLWVPEINLVDKPTVFNGGPGGVPPNQQTVITNTGTLPFVKENPSIPVEVEVEEIPTKKTPWLAIATIVTAAYLFISKN